MMNLKNIQKIFLGTIFYLRITVAMTATAITKRNTVNKENPTNQKVLVTCKKGLLPYTQDLLTYTKKYSLKYTKNPRQILTANSHGKFLRQTPTANSRGKFSNMQYKR